MIKQVNGNLIVNGLIQSKLEFSNSKDTKYANSFVRNVSTFFQLFVRTQEAKQNVLDVKIKL